MNGASSSRRRRRHGRSSPARPPLAVAYTRFSPYRDSSRLSAEDKIPAQGGRIQALCEAKGLTLVAVVCEPRVSAWEYNLADRPGGRVLLDLLAEHRAWHVVGDRLDRVFRCAADCRAQVEAWTQAGVAFHLVQFAGGSLDTSSWMGKVFLGLAGEFAEMEAHITAERTSQAMRVYQEHGRRMSYRPRIGWQDDPTSPASTNREGTVRTIHVRLQPDPAEGQAVRRIVQLAEEGHGPRAIARILTQEGHRPRGRRWYHQTIQRVLGRQA